MTDSTPAEAEARLTAALARLDAYGMSGAQPVNEDEVPPRDERTERSGMKAPESFSCCNRETCGVRGCVGHEQVLMRKYVIGVESEAWVSTLPPLFTANSSL